MHKPPEPIAPPATKGGAAAMAMLVLLIAAPPTLTAQSPLSFFNSANVTIGDNPVDIATGDFNRDGKPDLVVLNQTSESVSVLLGDGLGDFSAGPNLSVISGPRAVLVGDLDRNGIDDVTVVNSTSQDIVVRLGLANGAFGAANGFAAGISGNSGVIADFNEDGRLDVIVVGLNGGVRFFQGNGNGTFAASVVVNVVNARRHVATADFNRDGHLDLVFPAGASQVTIALGVGDGTFGAGTAFSTIDQPLELAPVDLNRDGRMDLGIATTEINKMALLLGDGNGGFGAPSTPFTTQTNHVKVADFDRDGIPDLLLVNFVNNRVDVKSGVGDGTLATTTVRTVVNDPVDLVVADFNRDGKPDYAVTTSDGTTAADTVAILLNQHEAVGIPVNVSTRALATSTSSVIPGFVVNEGPMRVLVRAVGPGLAQFGVNNFLANPKLTIFLDDAPLFSNDDWSADPGNQSTVAAVTDEVGAFPLEVGSTDAAIVVTLEQGAYTVVGAGDAGTQGEVLVEVYRADF